MFRKIMVCLLILLAGSLPARAGQLQDWKDQILYFILIDRFANGMQENDADIDARDPDGFHGGDIAGVINNLDYLQNLGVTGIWISPFIKNRPGRFFRHQPYHGYWPYDFWAVDERFGSEKDLVSLREQLRNREMKLILDMVVNHMGYDAPFVKMNPEWFNPVVNIENWEDSSQLENRSIFGLPDFASQKPVVKTFFRLVARHWYEILRPDGFRLDAVKHVPAEFWADFNSSARQTGGAGVIRIGEFLHGNPEAAVNIWKKGEFDSLFDFPLYYTMKEVFAGDASMRRLASRIYQDRHYPDPGMLATFLDNHDLDRFVTSCNGDLRKYRLALAFLLTSRGIPTLCYGDEQGLQGAHDPVPLNRRSMDFSHDRSLFIFTRDLIALRKNCEALRRGLTCSLFIDDKAWSFARLTPDSLAIMVFNNGDEPKQIDFSLPFKLNGNPKVIDSAIGTARALLRQGRMETFLPARSFAVFIPDAPPCFYEKPFRAWQKRFYHEKAWGDREVTVKLKVDYLPQKAKVFVTGNSDELGNWDSGGRALAMEQVMDDEYEVKVKLPLGKIIECKCFYRLEKEVVWQSGDNTIAEIRPEGTEYIHLDWKTMQ
jgi:glycosidase